MSYLRLETSQICLHIFHFCEKLRYVRVLFGWPQFLDQRQTHRIHHEIPSPFQTSLFNIQILPSKSRENSPPTFSKNPSPETTEKWRHPVFFRHPDSTSDSNLARGLGVGHGGKGGPLGILGGPLYSTPMEIHPYINSPGTEMWPLVLIGV